MVESCFELGSTLKTDAHMLSEARSVFGPARGTRPGLEQPSGLSWSKWTN